MSRIENDSDSLLQKGKKLEEDDQDDIFAPKSNGKDLDEFEDDSQYQVPKKFHWCQWIIVGLLYLILAFLVGFIIYISSTWNKDRTNEYT